MLTADGKSAVDTKLDHDSPAYKALSQKHPYVGDARRSAGIIDAEMLPLSAITGASPVLGSSVFRVEQLPHVGAVG